MMGNEIELKIAGVIDESIVDGPGIRYVVFVQGCPHHCEGCHNPQTHDFSGGQTADIPGILGEIDRDPMISGVTFSGGEPFCQPEAFCNLAAELKKRNLNIMAYSGFTYEELTAMKNPAVDYLLSMLDLLVDGRYVAAERDLTLLFRGSRNQRVIDMNKTRTAGKVILAEKYI